MFGLLAVHPKTSTTQSIYYAFRPEGLQSHSNLVSETGLCVACSRSLHGAMPAQSGPAILLSLLGRDPICVSRLHQTVPSFLLLSDRYLPAKSLAVLLSCRKDLKAPRLISRSAWASSDRQKDTSTPSVWGNRGPTGLPVFLILLLSNRPPAHFSSYIHITYLSISTSSLPFFSSFLSSSILSSLPILKIPRQFRCNWLIVSLASALASKQN